MPGFEDRTADWIPLAEARRRILASASPTGIVSLSPPEAVGLALSAPVVAPVTLPEWASSAMDGYAVRGSDVEGAAPDRPSRLRVVGLVRPGELPAPGPGPGEAIRILTGAPVPLDADSVIRVEDTDRESGSAGMVQVLSHRDVGRHVRPAGEDVRAGETVLLAGTPVESGTLALLAGLGIGRVAVHAPPRVAILATGDELVPAFGPAPEDPRATAPLRDSNGPALEAAVRGAGGRPLPPVLVPDDPDSLREAVQEAAAASDLLLVSGGASMGEADLVKRVLDAMGFRLDFWRVRIRPGSPFGFGYLPRKGAPLPVASLPGNPASALVTFEVLVRPLVRALGGHVRRHRLILDARASEALPGTGGELVHLVRVTLQRRDGEWAAAPAGPQRSNLLAPLARAHGIAEIPPGPGIPAGGQVRVHLLTPDTDAAMD